MAPLGNRSQPAGNRFWFLWRVPRRSDLRPLATGCNNGAPERLDRRLSVEATSGYSLARAIDSGLDQPRLVRVDNRLDPVAQFELLEDSGDVRFRCRFAD